ncbi:hypothetical protein K523DRAFT_359109 [Schizophyllum commune Tattone D]|nr:hypothetical protein K523DRAFT_359109 [Schizophyllum commune Tattone D]
MIRHRLLSPVSSTVPRSSSFKDALGPRTYFAPCCYYWGCPCEGTKSYGVVDVRGRILHGLS